jgi:hypothetical protein
MAVEIDPVTLNALKAIVPAPEIVFDAPVSVIVPAVAVNDPPTASDPAIVSDDAVLYDPEIVMLPKAIPVPVIAFDAPLNVIVPLPPGVRVQLPDPVVVKLPETVRTVFAATVTPPVMTRSLKLFVPLPPSAMPAPVNVTLPVLPL